jgi:dimeric dUTPase (all-alpha-NTP-PPase superfamily)
MAEDKLVGLMTKQRQLQEDLGYNFETMTKEERSAYIKEYAQHTDHEIHEMLQELPFFKSWKKYNTDPEAMALAYAKSRKEWVDVLHFFLNVTIALGFTPDELYHMYMDKHQENYSRQEDTSNYKKCVED